MEGSSKKEKELMHLDNSVGRQVSGGKGGYKGNKW